MLYFSLLIIHELGHAITGKLLGYSLDKISFYPYGGVTSFNMPLNVPLKKELLILLMGPFFQIIGYMTMNYFLSLPLLKTYHYTLLIFNLLPIYPLDGGRILNIIFHYQFNYLTSFKLSMVISSLILMALMIYNVRFFNLNLCLMIIVLFIKMLTNYHKRYLYYERFLLERYLYSITFPKKSCVDSLKKFYRDRVHIVRFEEEPRALRRHFQK